MRTTLKNMPNVAVIIDAIEEVDRGILLGILKYSKFRGHWWISVFPTNITELKHSEFPNWKGHGIIAQMRNDEVCELVMQKSVPTVAIDLSESHLLPSHPASLLPEIRGNSEKVGIMAAEFFLERRFVNFAYVGDTHNANWSTRRQKTYTNRLHQNGFTCHVYSPSASSRRSKRAYQKEMGQWLCDLPKPVAVFAANDTHACLVLEICRSHSLHIPGEISLLGVDNDQIRCEMAEPSLTSIARNHIKGGFAGAEYLDQMMRHRISERRIFSVEPTMIITRHSTVPLNVDDPWVAQAVSFIHAHFGMNINVSDVVKHVDIRRRRLEERFRRVLNHSIHDEIDQVRIDRIQQLLIETDMTIKEIAETCCFSSEMYLSTIFRKKTGLTMNSFRTHHRNFM